MAALEDKIATLEADFSKYASDFVKLNELTKKRSCGTAAGGKNGTLDVLRRPGSKNCGAVEISLVDSIK